MSYLFQVIYHTQVWFVRWNKYDFFQAVPMSMLLYRYTSWTLNNIWKKNSMGTTISHLTNHLIKKCGRTRHCRRNKNELISKHLLWTPTRGRAINGWQAKTYLLQFSADCPVRWMIRTARKNQGCPCCQWDFLIMIYIYIYIYIYVM